MPEVTGQCSKWVRGVANLCGPEDVNVFSQVIYILFSSLALWNQKQITCLSRSHLTNVSHFIVWLKGWKYQMYTKELASKAKCDVASRIWINCTFFFVSWNLVVSFAEFELLSTETKSEEALFFVLFIEEMGGRESGTLITSDGKCFSLLPHNNYFNWVHAVCLSVCSAFNIFSDSPYL